MSCWKTTREALGHRCFGAVQRIKLLSRSSCEGFSSGRAIPLAEAHSRLSRRTSNATKKRVYGESFAVYERRSTNEQMKIDVFLEVVFCSECGKKRRDDWRSLLVNGFGW
jgi:hypothetical protein